jgi:effector-binding domain-containing protein
VQGLSFVVSSNHKSIMQVKTIRAMEVLCFETETTLEKMQQYIRIMARRLYSEASKLDLEITGPIYWLYDGADGKPDTIFKLTIALPVTTSDRKITGSEFRIQTLDTFFCLAEQHLGNWMDLGKTYCNLMMAVNEKNLQVSGLVREIYLNMDFHNPEANITEVQMGLLHKDLMA